MKMPRYPVVLTLTGCFAAALFAQAAATLSGDLRDQSGSPIVNATVSLKNEASGLVSKTISDTAGHYSIAGLSTGSYTVEVSAPNFSTSRREGVRIAGGATEEFSTALALAALPQT